VLDKKSHVAFHRTELEEKNVRILALIAMHQNIAVLAVSFTAPVK
jgi:hypothetical protein